MLSALRRLKDLRKSCALFTLRYRTCHERQKETLRRRRVSQRTLLCLIDHSVRRSLKCQPQGLYCTPENSEAICSCGKLILSDTACSKMSMRSGGCSSVFPDMSADSQVAFHTGHVAICVAVLGCEKCLGAQCLLCDTQ